MLREWIKSTFDNIHQRIRNPFTERNTTPFAGAFLIALVIYNWRLFFSLFNFDKFESRTSKIQIIADYLYETGWFQRLLWPLAIAFGTIVFYYLFNNISLGITTFFNRWFKATVLYFTDTSKIITREELDQSLNKMSTLRQRYEELKRTFAESQSELENLKSQKESKEGELVKLKLDFDKATNDLKEKIETLAKLELHQNEFKILFARYGKDENYINVTVEVNHMLAKNGSFVAENKVFDKDPIKFTVKELFIIYQISQMVDTFTANENEIVEIKDDRLVSQETAESKRKQITVKNIKKLADIFKDVWQLSYSKGNITSTEKVIIDDSGKYFVNNKHTFNIRNVMINEKKMTFNKIKLDGTLHAEEKLDVSSD